MQRVTGDLMRVSVATSCNIIHKVSGILASLMRNYVKFSSTPAARTRMTQTFYGIAHFTGVAGCTLSSGIPEVRTPKCIVTEKEYNCEQQFAPRT